MTSTQVTSEDVRLGPLRLHVALRTRQDPTIYEYYPAAGHGFSYTPGEANERAHRYAWATTLSLFAQTFQAA